VSSRSKAGSRPRVMKRVHRFIIGSAPRPYITLDMVVSEDWEILDATAGLRFFWRRRDAKRVLFLDLRREVFPDIVGSNEFLPFQDGVFSQVFYDPSYFYGKEEGSGFFRTDLGFRFWAWKSKRQLLRNVIAVNREFWRVLRPDGVLLFEWTDMPGGVPHEFVLGLLNNFRLVDSRKSRSKGGTENIAYLFTLKKIE